MKSFPFYQQPDTMILKLVCTCFFIVIIFNAKAQQKNISITNNNTIAIQKAPRTKLVKLPNADADKAIEIQDAIAGSFNVSLGYGLIRSQLDSNTGYQIIEENSAWFKFIVKHDTALVFDIVSADNRDDYDFVLFKCMEENWDGKMKQLKMVRFCVTACNSTNGMTGLSRFIAGNKIGNGFTSSDYASALPVKAGETYYLMVNFSQVCINMRGAKQSGFTIYFYETNPQRKPVVLNNIFFETNKAVLKTESFPELDKLVSVLNKSQMVIDIRGHTDNEGDEKKNQLLSEERAKAVVDYLVSKQINKNRLFYKGFGSSKPIASNNTKEGRQKNRRVEFVKSMY